MLSLTWHFICLCKLITAIIWYKVAIHMPIILFFFFGNMQLNYCYFTETRKMYRQSSVWWNFTLASLLYLLCVFFKVSAGTAQQLKSLFYLQLLFRDRIFSRYFACLLIQQYSFVRQDLKLNCNIFIKVRITFKDLAVLFANDVSVLFLFCLFLFYSHVDIT